MPSRGTWFGKKRTQCIMFIFFYQKTCTLITKRGECYSANVHWGVWQSKRFSWQFMCWEQGNSFKRTRQFHSKISLFAKSRHVFVKKLSCALKEFAVENIRNCHACPHNERSLAFGVKEKRYIKASSLIFLHQAGFRIVRHVIRCFGKPAKGK